MESKRYPFASSLHYTPLKTYSISTGYPEKKEQRVDPGDLAQGSRV